MVREQMRPQDLHLVDLEVTSLSARQSSGSRHTRWFVGYATEPEQEVHGRVVFATLHVYGERGGGEVSVAVIMVYPDDVEPTTEEFVGALVESDALESLYDYARTVLRGLLGFVDVSVTVRRKAPKPKLDTLTKVEAVPIE
jgi:hypothetical protein